MPDHLPKDLVFLRKKRSDIDHSIAGGTLAEDGGLVLLSPDQRSVHTYVVGVSGSGKSRFLQALLFQDIAKGHPLCLVDPMGDLYAAVRDFVATGTERMAQSGIDPEDILKRFLFLDLTDAENPVKYNPLAPTDHETSENLVDDLLKAIERLLGRNLEDQRILRNILRGVFMMTAELNRLAPARRPPLPPQCQGTYPLNLSFAADLLLLGDEQRLALMDALGSDARLRFRRQYWSYFARLGRIEQSRLIQSSWNVLQYLVDDTLALRALDTHQSTLDFGRLLRDDISLICHLPIGENLTGVPFLGRLITTKLQRVAYRRQQDEWKNRYYLYLDEFHHFADLALAQSMTDLRKYGLSLVNAHQSQSQPPFETPQGQALLATVKANSQIKVVFRLDRADAETMAKELYAITAPEVSHHETSRSETYSKSHSRSLSFSFQVTEGTSYCWSRSRTISLGQTHTIGIGRTFGTNIGLTVTKAVGGSLARGLATAIGRSESEGVTEAYNESLQMSVAVGRNWAQVRDHRRGLSLTRGENAVFAVQRSQGQSLTASEQHGETNTRGHSVRESEGQSDTLTHGANGSISYYTDNKPRTTNGTSSSLASMRSISSSQEESLSKATSLLRGVAHALSEQQGLTISKGTRQESGTSFSLGESLQQGGSHVDTETRGRGRSRSHSREVGRTWTTTETTTETESWQDSVARAFSVLDQVSQSYSEALQQIASHQEGVALTEKLDYSRGETEAEAESWEHSMTKTRRPIYLTLDEKRERMVNRLQQLGNREAILTTAALSAQLIETLFVPDDQYVYVAVDYPRLMLDLQRVRLRGLVEPEAPTLPRSQPGQLRLGPQRLDEGQAAAEDNRDERDGTNSADELRDDSDPFLD
ncbi:MAG: type IV secretion system DNA-binding domain-containing protein [Acidobacteria bacterium]|nr:type IV secretion system DNA-binding domain-containing protein [Acidobacteriota bacterium]